MFLEAIPTRLQSLKKLHGWKLEKCFELVVAMATIFRSKQQHKYDCENVTNLA